MRISWPGQSTNDTCLKSLYSPGQPSRSQGIETLWSDLKDYATSVIINVSMSGFCYSIASRSRTALEGALVDFGIRVTEFDCDVPLQLVLEPHGLDSRYGFDYC